MKQVNDSRSSIIWYSYRYDQTPIQIYNLFSNFGNISCIIVKKDILYIKFRTK